MSGPGGRRVAVVTGTSSGIGRAVGEELLRSAWRVVGISRRPGAIAASTYMHLRHDLGDPSGLVDRVEEAVTSVLDGQPVSRLALVNNAADPALLGTVARLDGTALPRVFTVNVAAPLSLMGWAVRRTTPDVPLRIVNVSSGAAVRPFPGLGAYGSSKAALRMAGMVLGSELDGEAETTDSRRDVTILSYSPGRVDTAMQAAARATPAGVFPLLETFHRWFHEGQLMSPGIPAREIRAYVEADGYPTFFECGSGEIKGWQP